MSTSMSMAVSRPSRVTPVRCRMTAGWRFVVAILPRQDRRVARDHRRILLLASESAAGLGLDDPHLFVGQPEKDLQRAVNVVRALERAVHGDAAVLRHGDHAVGFDVELFLVPGTVLSLDDDLGVAEPAGEVALFNRDLLEDLWRACGVVARLASAIVDRDPTLRVQESLAFLVRDEEDRLGEVADFFFRQTWLIELDQRDRVSAGDVTEVGDREARAVEVEADPRDLALRNRRSDRARVEHPREDEVVDVLRPAGDLVEPFLPADIPAHGSGLGIGAHGWARMLPHDGGDVCGVDPTSPFRPRRPRRAREGTSLKGPPRRTLPREGGD
jgi:hypothetical protein